MEFNILCINAANKPAEYTKKDAWLKHDQLYTPIKVSKLIDGNIGVKVEEITPSEENPFQYFNINRFAVPEEFFEWADEQLRNQPEDNFFDVGELIKEEVEYGTPV